MGASCTDSFSLLQYRVERCNELGLCSGSFPLYYELFNLGLTSLPFCLFGGFWAIRTIAIFARLTTRQ
jgi:hypothetical protein